MGKDAPLIHPKGRALIKEFEGLRLVAYVDAVGIWTNGYGHTGSDVKKGQRITELQAEAWLEEDIAEAAAIVDTHVKAPLHPLQRAALISFVFNVGPGKKGKKDGFVELKRGGSSTLLKKLNAHDYDGAALEFPKWVHADGLVLKGLVRRRAAEQALFLEGLTEEPESVLESNIIPSGAEPEGPVATNKGVQATTVTAAGAVVAEAAKGFEPLVQYSEIIQWVFVALTVIGILYAIRGAKRG